MNKQALSIMFAAALALLAADLSHAEEISERVIRWGHLNNTDHPISLAVHKFAEIVAQKSGGKMKSRVSRVATR